MFLSREMLLPCEVHTTLLCITPTPSKPVPVIVSARSGLPATALTGDNELIDSASEGGAGGGGDGVEEGGCTEAEPPPQPDNATTPAIANAVPVSHFIEPPWPLFEDLRRFFWYSRSNCDATSSNSG